MHQIKEMNNYELYKIPACQLAEQLTPEMFGSLMAVEPFDMELAVILIRLIEDFIDIEEYMYCAHIKGYFDRHRGILTELL